MDIWKKMLCGAIVLCYIVGLVCLFMSKIGLGLLLWTVSTLGGGSLLVHWRHKRERAEEEAKAEGQDNE